MFKYASMVPARGFSWREDLVVEAYQEGPLSMGAPPYLVALGDRIRFIYPLEDHPGLFATFAEIKEGPDSELTSRILGFANKYGRLGQPTWVYSVDGKGNSQMITGEGLNIWKKEIEDMALANKLWRWLNNASMTNLALHVRWNQRAVGVSYAPLTDLGGLEELNKPGHPAGLVYAVSDDISFSTDDPIGPTKYFLKKLINEKLAGHVSPRVVMDHKYKLIPYFIPDSLLAAMWFQFFQAVTGATDFIQCEICGGLIEKKRGGRSTKKVHTHCSKNRSYKKGKARDMFKEGVSLPDIADIIGEKQEIVTEWTKEWKSMPGK